MTRDSRPTVSHTVSPVRRALGFAASRYLVVKTAVTQWAQQDSNLRPLDYESQGSQGGNVVSRCVIRYSGAKGGANRPVWWPFRRRVPQSVTQSGWASERERLAFIERQLEERSWTRMRYGRGA